jgi:Na+(H+)/acetate symporter ActP
MLYDMQIVFNKLYSCHVIVCFVHTKGIQTTLCTAVQQQPGSSASEIRWAPSSCEGVVVLTLCVALTLALAVVAAGRFLIALATAAGRRLTASVGDFEMPELEFVSESESLRLTFVLEPSSV